MPIKNDRTTCSTIWSSPRSTTVAIKSGKASRERTARDNGRSVSRSEASKSSADPPAGVRTHDSTLGRTLAPPATVLPEEVCEDPQRIVRCRVIDEFPLAARRNEPGIDEANQVVVKSRPRDAEARLQVRRRYALGAGLDGLPGGRVARRDRAQQAALRGVRASRPHV